jgi:predicted RNase H-like HicB family nuclease
MARRETITAKEYRYTAVFEPAEEGGYVVTVPALPGVVTEGDSLEEARAMAADAIRCYLESLQKDGLPIPAGEYHDVGPIREQVTVRLKAV